MIINVVGGFGMMMIYRLLLRNLASGVENAYRRWD
jgi:hypothetical protein